ncbi:hypothetical protein AKJ16_DCAP01650 [Drosera capensis]
MQTIFVPGSSMSVEQGEQAALCGQSWLSKGFGKSATPHSLFMLLGGVRSSGISGVGQGQYVNLLEVDTNYMKMEQHPGQDILRSVEKLSTAA